MLTRNFTVSTICLLILLGFASLSSAMGKPASGGAPRNLRVSGVTDWTVDLQWDMPKGKAPSSYVVQCSNGRSMSVPGTQTSATFSSGFDFNRTYSFRAYAVSASGSWSNASNWVSATLLPDTTPPTKPILSANVIGPTHIDLAWSTVDACPILRFDVYVNDTLRHSQVAGNGMRITFLRPNTTYSFRVRARDAGGNWSPMSDAFVVTTASADPNDITPPETPPGLWGDLLGCGTEAIVYWGASKDDVTPRSLIQYHVYLNGVFEGATIAPYANQFTLYLTAGIVNMVEVVAVDEAGNRSAPAKLTFDIP